MIIDIVFDLDGTLITCEEKHKYALHAIMKNKHECNFEKINQWWELKRNGFNTENALIELGITDAKKISQEWINSIENIIWSSLDSPFKDSLLALKFLKEKYHLNLSILTARKSKLAVFQTIYRAGFNQYVDDIIVVNPQSVIEEKSAYLSKVHPLVYIGDNELDYSSAKRSKVRFLALTRGQRSYEFLSTLGEIHIENDLGLLMDNKFITKLLETKH